jgi:hypothetical protein
MSSLSWDRVSLSELSGLIRTFGDTAQQTPLVAWYEAAYFFALINHHAGGMGDNTLIQPFVPVSLGSRVR